MSCPATLSHNHRREEEGRVPPCRSPMLCLSAQSQRSTCLCACPAPWQLTSPCSGEGRLGKRARAPGIKNTEAEGGREEARPRLGVRVRPTAVRIATCRHSCGLHPRTRNTKDARDDMASFYKSVAMIMCAGFCFLGFLSFLPDSSVAL